MMESRSIKLRPYQNEAIRAINEHWQEWDRELLVLPTGCGKTIVFNSIAYDRPGNVLILAHRDELIEQARDKYFSSYGELAGKIKSSTEDIRHVTVGSVQTMQNRDYSGQFQTVIVDEAHHAVSPSYQTVLGQFPEAKVLGVTATPDRGDKKSLAKYFDGIAYEYGLKQAVAEGYLSPIVAKTIPLEIDMTECKVSIGDFELGSIAESLDPYLEQIADAIRTEAADRKTVVFCPLISIAQELASMIPGAREVNGQSVDRAETLAWFDQAGPGAVLCNAMLLTEGWDCPSCDCVVVLRPTKIRSLYCQMVGRGTRLFPGKENLLILDFLWLTGRHNLCKPASLISDNDSDIETVVRASKDEEIDLFGAVSDAEEARRQALAAQLEKQRKKKSKLIDPLTVFSILDDIGLADYEPTFKWEEEDATEKQIRALNNFGIDADGITKGYACQLMDKLVGRIEKNLATVKQVQLLRRFGYDAINWSFEHASYMITKLAKNNWRRA